MRAPVSPVTWRRRVAAAATPAGRAVVITGITNLQYVKSIPFPHLGRGRRQRPRQARSALVCGGLEGESRRVGSQSRPSASWKNQCINLCAVRPPAAHDSLARYSAMPRDAAPGSISPALIVLWTACYPTLNNSPKGQFFSREVDLHHALGSVAASEGRGMWRSPQYRLSPGVKTRPRGHAWSKQPDLKQHFIRPSTEAFPQEGRYRTH
ncbi:hypothetical protein E2C01_040516 [Portunus trituberculatus]|uniref:Uncharacterized protein n=1 Tax=Portunus trituberculatus TaxID=210409 RepID=A0A5B7FGW8_PORTR|nr:hypothetical protein [Portunus trituberculatus]